MLSPHTDMGYSSLFHCNYMIITGIIIIIIIYRFVPRMATDDHMTCQLCSKLFTDPRILPCLHSFCCQCLHKESEKVAPHQSLQCPICLRNAPIPVGGASALPKNLHLEFEVEVAECMSKFVSSSEVPCSFCANGCTNPAVVFCCTCHKFLCKGGQDSHNRVGQLLEHRVIAMSKESATLLPTIMKPIDHYCSQPRHKKQELDFYCKTCSCFICRDCYISLHNNHTIAELSIIAEAHRDEMRGTLQFAKEAMSTLTNAIDTKNKMIHKLENSKTQAELTIKRAFERLMETLEERKKALLLELESVSLSKTTPLILQKEQFEKLQRDIGRYSEVTSHILQTHTDYEVVALGELVPTEMKATLKRAKNVSHIQNEGGGFKMSVQTGSLVKELSKFGSVVDLSSAQGKGPPLSVAKVNTKYHLKIKAGERYQCAGLQVKSQLKPESPDGPVTSEQVEERGDGTYTITLTPECTGPHRLHITVDGQQVEKGPHNTGYDALSSPHQVIDVEQPYCVALGENGDIYVGSNDDCIYVFDQDGHLKSTYGNSGSDKGQFNVPADMCIIGDVMYVADLGNNRIQKLTTGGELLQVIGEGGAGQGQFRAPSGVIVDSNDRLIVSDRDNHRVQVFNQDGVWLLTIDGNGTGDSAFSDPCGLALDPQGNIYIAAGGSNTIKVFSPDGTYVRTYGDVNGPTGIAVNEEGYIFVSEGDGNCLSIFDPQGYQVHTVGDLKNPSGVTLDATTGSIYVPNFVGCNVLRLMM